LWFLKQGVTIKKETFIFNYKFKGVNMSILDLIKNIEIPVLLFLSILVLLATPIAFATYILSSIGLSKLAKEIEIPYQFYAWIPFVKLYLLGELIGDQVEIRGKTYRYVKITLVVISFALYLVMTALFELPGIWSNLGIILLCFTWIYVVFCMFSLYEIYIPDKAKKYALITMIVPFMAPVFIFRIRNNQRTYIYLPSELENEIRSRTIIGLIVGSVALINIFFPDTGNAFFASIIGFYFCLDAFMWKKSAMAIVGLIISAIAFIISGASFILILLFFGGGTGYYRMGLGRIYGRL
jgi:hypothetical protein